MEAFVLAFTAFNAVTGVAGLIRGLRLWSPTQREAWKSSVLYYFAIWIAVSLPVVGITATLAAWHALGQGDRAAAGPLVLAPLAWLIVMGVVFAILDFADDGRINFDKSDPNGPPAQAQGDADQAG